MEKTTGWSLTRKLIVGFGAMCAIATGSAAVSLVNIGTLGGLFDTVINTDAKKLELVETIARTPAVRWLGVEAGNEGEQMSRVLLQSVPYARVEQAQCQKRQTDNRH